MDAGTFRAGTRVSLAGASYTPAGAVQAFRAGPNRLAQQTLTFGTGPGECDLVVLRDLPPLAAGASTTLDLYDGSVLDVFGQPAPFRKLRAVVAWVSAGGDAAGVDVGSDGVVSNPAPAFLKGTNPRASIFPAAVPYAGGSAAGLTIDATHRNLLVTNQGAVSATVTLALAGASA